MLNKYHYLFLTLMSVLCKFCLLFSKLNGAYHTYCWRCGQSVLGNVEETAELCHERPWKLDMALLSSSQPWRIPHLLGESACHYVPDSLNLCYLLILPHWTWRKRGLTHTASQPLHVFQLFFFFNLLHLGVRTDVSCHCSVHQGWLFRHTLHSKLCKYVLIVLK